MSAITTNIVFALSLLLAAGFALARVAKAIRLPSVTGYIAAGIVLGPSALDLFPSDMLEQDLQVFINMALMLVAFGIGERFDLQQLRPIARTVMRVSIAEIGSVFLLVSVGVGVSAYFLTGSNGPMPGSHAIAVGLICAAIAVETAAATTIAVIREVEASGPMSRLVLSDVVVNNAMAVTLFGISVAVAYVLLGAGEQSPLTQVLLPFFTTVASLLLGFAVGLACDWVVHRLHRRSDVLVVALASIFFCGGLANFIGLSPLLAGVATGFAIVNRDRRDVRAFRALNDFEPPLYGIFFALAGAQLHLQELLAAGVLGLVFVTMRFAGKYLGSRIGALRSGIDRKRAAVLGLGLLPQAGLAIGLAYLVRQDAALQPISALVINLVLSSVVINELIGPPLVRMMLTRAGEVSDEQTRREEPEATTDVERIASVDVVPWTWPKLEPPATTGGSVIIGLSHPETAAALTRIGVILAKFYEAEPTAVHVSEAEHPDDFWDTAADQDAVALFRLADEEARSLGYPLDTEVEFADDTALGLLRAAEDMDAQAIVLGHPRAHRAPRFGQIVDNLAREALCPVVVARFVGPLHTERILVPLTCPEDYLTVRPIVKALSAIEEHEITFLRLMPAECQPRELREAEERVMSWPKMDVVPGTCTCVALATESRLHTIVEAAEDHNIIVMATSGRRGLRRAFFGSLAEDVARRAPCSMLLVSGGLESRSLEELEVATQDV